MTVEYEWDVETVAEGSSEDYDDGECIDHCHSPTYAECLAFIARSEAPAGTRYSVVLVRDDDDRRAWAYVENGALPAFFIDGDGNDYKRVPMRFHAELIR